MDSLLNQIQGGIFGLAVGDALGCTLEFLNQAQIEHMIRMFGKHIDIKGGGPFHFEEGEVTDDTDMTLCVARGILKSPTEPTDSIGEEFLKWLDSDPKDVGMTVRQSLINFHHTKNWEQSSFLTHKTLGGKSGGNGSLMRCLPISLAYKEIKFISRLSVKQSKLTHYDQSAAECCVLYNQIANLLLNGFTLELALDRVLDGTRFYHSLRNKPFSNPDAYVINTFEWLCYMLFNTKTFEESIVESVNLGYDSDTLGSVVGGLSGLYYGYDSIPTRFTEKILISNELINISENLYKLRAEME